LKYTLYTILILVLPFAASSQQFYIKGQVKDEAGNLLQNVTILQHSTGYKYFTGTEGSFGILTSGLLDTLVFIKDGFVKEKIGIRANDFVDVRLKKMPTVKSSSTNKLSSITQNLRRDVQQQWFVGEETYASLIENNFIPADNYPSTSITLNVDRASYSNIRRLLNTNTIVPPDAVRIEEMLGYFNINYTEPKRAETFKIQTTLTNCPWNKNNHLLFAQINAKKLNLGKLPPTQLVFLIDVSGSMDMPNRLPLLKEGFKLLVKNLRAIDSVAIVVYGGNVGLALNTTGGGEKDKICKVIDSLQPGGSTPGESGIKIAYNLAKAHYIKEGNNRVILATDGDFNVGLKNDEELEKLISEQKTTGIYLTCLGIGMGNYKDSKIQSLAKRGNGNFAYLDSYGEAEKVLLTDFTQTLYTVADNASFNVSFNPQYVKEYRLVGFDNKVNAIKDSSSVIEGGEIGSGFSTLIAFEIVPDKEAYQQKPVEFTLRYKDPVTGQVIDQTEKPEVAFIPFSELYPSYQFATSVIMFGSLLRKSNFIKTSWSDVYKLAKTSANEDNFSQKEFLTLVDQARKLYGKKRKKED
jgi:Ca-activated chloride channel family protein